MYAQAPRRVRRKVFESFDLQIAYDKAECAYASVDIENENGEIERVAGAEAGLDEDEIGWCLQFTDEARMVEVIGRMPPK